MHSVYSHITDLNNYEALFTYYTIPVLTLQVYCIMWKKWACRKQCIAYLEMLMKQVSSVRHHVDSFMESKSSVLNLNACKSGWFRPSPMLRGFPPDALSHKALVGLHKSEHRPISLREEGGGVHRSIRGPPLLIGLSPLTVCLCGGNPITIRSHKPCYLAYIDLHTPFLISLISPYSHLGFQGRHKIERVF